MEWRPIDTAPKDGTPVLLFVPAHQPHRWVTGQTWPPETITVVGFWEAGGNYEGDEAGWDAWPNDRGYPCLYPEHPTHWMPLPPAPPKRK